MRSKFALNGHPLHPLLVSLPIGLFIWALVADLVYVLGDRDQTWYDISYWSGIAAIATALLAALPGFGDFLTLALRSDARGIATIHMLLNLTVVGLFVAGALLAMDEGALAGDRLTALVGLHIVGVGLLGLAGYLGGDMVYRHHLGMVPDDGPHAMEEERRHVISGGLR